MHIFATGCCVLVTGSIYKRNKTRKTAVIALILGALVQTAAMVLMNMILRRFSWVRPWKRCLR